jgi:5-hydroxyisourate hydrolase
VTVSTHVLDASLGAPAAGVAVTLSVFDVGWSDLESAVTDADGRHRFDAATPPGTYRLAFATGPYFGARGVRAFYPEVAVAFTASDSGHLHVPLLLSPFAYSTYRGS